MILNRRYIITLSTQFIIIGSVFLFFYQYPVMYVRLISEDNIGEYLTFLFYLMASVLFLKYMFACNNYIQKGWLLLFVCFAFFCGMEEISWGQRLLGFKTPYFIKKYNFQEEMTLHNIRAISPDTWTYILVSIGLFIYGFMLPLLKKISTTVENIIDHNLHLPVPPLSLSPMFIATSLFLQFSFFFKGEEIGELFLPLSLFLFAINLVITQEINHGIREKHRLDRVVFIEPMIIFTAIIISTGLTYIKPDKNDFKWRLNTIAGEYFPKNNLYEQSEKVYSFIETNYTFKTHDYYVNKGEFYLKIDKKKEAIKLLQSGLQIDLGLLEKTPSNPAIMIRIARIYFNMGNMEYRNRYINYALKTYETILKTSDSVYEKALAHMGRGELFESIGDLNESLKEYFKAARISNANFDFQPKIESAIHLLGERCLTDQKHKYKRLSWQEMQEIGNQVNKNGSERNFCIKNEKPLKYF